ncbi:hypothetical protein GCM10022224_083530 [Nonomuraea antimicrobica]|uniref:Uncharacterized protein n=1 Tax=Nonomuraea antimicrobica TaxID=561173 RepID=A0ABP7DIX0_9ACTN
MTQTATAALLSAAPSHGSLHFPSPHPDDVFPGHSPPHWVEAVPPWAAALPLVTAGTPGFLPTPGSSPTSSVRARPDRPRSPSARPLTPPRERPPGRRGAPAPEASPQAPPRERPLPEPIREADPPPPPPSQERGMPLPCATFHDFRRQACYDVLNRLRR